MAMKLIEDEESAVSQRLIEASLSGNTDAVSELLLNKLVDVNYKGVVNLRVKYSDCIQHEEAPDELKIGYEEFRTSITPVFAAAHVGHLDILKRLLNAGADVNQKLYKGFATTAAAREGHHEALSLLLKSGASQSACEDALLEACLFGQVKAAELLMRSEMTRPEVTSNALVHASSRGLVDIVATLIKSSHLIALNAFQSRVDVNCWHRVLLRSVKPALHASVDCTPLFAAIVSRQIIVVEFLLKIMQAGARTNLKARLGAWTWDSCSGEALRVGAGMTEPYNEAWCAVEYWEASGAILKMLLRGNSNADFVHQGRSLLFHAILCRNVVAARALLEAGANAELCVQTRGGDSFRPLHYAARMGVASIVELLLEWRCDVDVRTGLGETALMICGALGDGESFRALVRAGADLAALDQAGVSVADATERCGNGALVHEAVRDAVLSGLEARSSAPTVFSPLRFAAEHGDIAIIERLLLKPLYVAAVDCQDDRLGYTATMLAAHQGHLDAFRALVFARANLSLTNKRGETALDIAERYGNKEGCEMVILDAILANVFNPGDAFQSLHFAARRGNVEVLAHLLKKQGEGGGNSVINSLDKDEHTPLMLSAKEGHAEACKLLLLSGADCCFRNSRGETALTLASANADSKLAEGAILDHIARHFVLSGERLAKHTREGRGPPHAKFLCMLESGVLTWGRARRQNVLCKEAAVGPSARFQKNRRRKGDAFKEGTFRIVTSSGREVHFVASASSEAEVWVRGINVISGEAMAPSG